MEHLNEDLNHCLHSEFLALSCVSNPYENSLTFLLPIPTTKIILVNKKIPTVLFYLILKTCILTKQHL